MNFVGLSDTLDAQLHFVLTQNLFAFFCSQLMKKPLFWL